MTLLSVWLNSWRRENCKSDHCQGKDWKCPPCVNKWYHQKFSTAYFSRSPHQYRHGTAFGFRLVISFLPEVKRIKDFCWNAAQSSFPVHLIFFWAINHGEQSMKAIYVDNQPFAPHKDALVILGTKCSSETYMAYLCNHLEELQLALIFGDLFNKN